MIHTCVKSLKPDTEPEFRVRGRDAEDEGEREP